jgi:hypothetical protein
MTGSAIGGGGGGTRVALHERVSFGGLQITDYRL